MQSIPLHVVPGGRSWPAELEAIPNPPTELWLRGRIECLQSPRRLAIVGSRSASGYGLDQAYRFGAALARAGYTIVSGMARGVDQAAHLGCLDAQGATIAVLGNGVDEPWPRFDGLARLMAHGVLLSEHPPGQGPRRHHFPLRNRLIAGLCDAVLVIEAAHASGSLITAHWALEQGREVFALPGRVDHPMAQGSLRLLREGARAVGSPEQVLADLGHSVPMEAEQGSPRPTGATEARICEALQGESLGVDELVQRLDLPLPELLAHLAELQLAGWVLRGPGGLYRAPPMDPSRLG
ncbi:MAG: DNA-protecting protein DprA [Planctomycetes bacterium]|nr:DNA-protecting protein DprA [Planctomycetota bacterium]MCB9910824.1 DNA-protecting protein DprA [Planctomycetota bacterium]MCB9912244.1 DNA-protecting protein DprA [Planctomycetota bacterium]HPF13839.1 DNA-processing protein DprA [Planctomycetota bacterium]